MSQQQNTLNFSQTYQEGELSNFEDNSEESANQIVRDFFGTEDNAKSVASLIQGFLLSYEQHKNSQTLEQWLISEFKKYPATWRDDEEIRISAREIIDATELANRTKASLQSNLAEGKSQASWLSKEIEKGASATGAVNVGVYASTIENALDQANKSNLDVILRKDGFVSMNPNLDGFIAEQHHVNTFNTDAVARGSEYRAKVLEPAPGEGYGNNSMDIGIYDGNGKLVRRYQAKYGKDSQTTAEMFKQGDYRGQRKLGPAGHGNDEIAEVIEIDGIKSKPLSKEDAKELQSRAQQENEVKQYEWNEVNRTVIAKQIGKQALVGASICAGMQGARILSRRIWNSLAGSDNPTVSEDLREFFDSSIGAATNVSVQVCVSGALVVAAKNGLLGKALKNTPAGRIANIAYIGLENAKIFFKLGKGELSKEEALNMMGQTTLTAIGALAGAVQGGELGAMLGIALGPAGAVAGGFVGGVIGSMAGSTIGQAVYEGGKSILKAGSDTIKSARSAIANRTAALMSFFA